MAIGPQALVSKKVTCRIRLADLDGLGGNKMANIYWNSSFDSLDN